MVRSLRWRLQIWHGALLIIVVVVFGSVLFLQIRHSTFNAIDSELIAGARILEGAIRTLPPGVIESGQFGVPPEGFQPNDPFRIPPLGVDRFPRRFGPRDDFGPRPNQQGPRPNRESFRPKSDSPEPSDPIAPDRPKDDGPESGQNAEQSLNNQPDQPATEPFDNRPPSQNNEPSDRSGESEKGERNRKQPGGPRLEFQPPNSERPFDGRPKFNGPRPSEAQRPMDGQRPADGPRPMDGNPDFSGQPRFEGGPPGFDPMRRLDRDLSLPPTRRIDQNDEEPYFVVYTGQGKVIRKTPGDLPTEFRMPQRPTEFRMVGSNREVFFRGPFNTVIVVGRDVQRAMNRLTAWAVQLIVLGLLVLALGLIGGWWLTGRAIRPIVDIGRTATRVSAKNLSERIDTTAMDIELRDLATVLNSMLGRLQESFDRQSQFTADASHELRTPVAVLLSNCELALTKDRSAGEYRNTIEICMKAGDRMRGLVEDLLLLAKADSGKLELNRTTVDLSELAADAIVMFESIAHKKSVTFETRLETARCMADSRRITQVIHNLVANAVQYNRESGKVTLRSFIENQHVVLQVTDNGYGIPAESLDKLFDRFYRVDAHRSRQHGGSGLGLAICKSIVDAHNGQLTVQSQENVGTTFELRLPVG